jgi:WD40 repeat protein
MKDARLVPLLLAVLAFSGPAAVSAHELGSGPTTTQGACYLWDAGGTPIRTLAEGTKAAMGAAFSPDSLRVAAAIGDGSLRIWQLDGAEGSTLWSAADGSPVARIDPPPDAGGSILDAALLPDGETSLVSSGSYVFEWRFQDVVIGRISVRADARFAAGITLDQSGVVIVDLGTGRSLFLAFYPPGGWLVYDATSRYDASVTDPPLCFASGWQMQDRAAMEKRYLSRGLLQASLQ